MKTIDIIAGILLLVGGLNWGLVGFFDYNLVGHIFGSVPMVGRLIYGLVGLSAIYKIFKCGGGCCHK